MLQLIIKLPENCNADALEEVIQGMGYYRDGIKHSFHDGYDGDYSGVFLMSVMLKDCDGNHHFPYREYEIDGRCINDTMLDVLIHLQKIVPFEMHFEQRGQYDPDLYSKPGYFDNSEPREPVKAIG